MLAFYAPGGGFGHVSRVGAVADVLGLAGQYALIASAPPAAAARLAPGARMIAIPASLEGRPEALRRWILDCVAGLGAQRLVVDAFPGGLFGELDPGLNDAGVELEHVARLLRWDDYRRRVPGPLPRFARTWTVEPLHDDHHAALRAVSGHVAALELAALARPVPTADPAVTPEWLVVHGGPADEVLELLDYAREAAAIEGVAPRLVVITEAVLPDAADWTRAAHADLARRCAGAQRIFSAAGFNTLRELRHWRSRVHCLPFPRAFDDQFERARRWRAGQV